MNLCYNELKYEEYTNLRKKIPGNQPQHLYASEHVNKKLSQNTFIKALLFGMYKEVGDSGWCRLDLTYIQLNMSLIKP